MTEETTMDERDVEQVARAIWEAHNADQGITHGEATEWGPEARAAIATLASRWRARLTGREAARIGDDWRMELDGRAAGWDDWDVFLASLAAHVFGPAPRVEPAPPRATREKSDAMAMHYTKSMHVDHVEPICGAPISPSRVTSSSAVVTCIECLRMRPPSVSPPFVEPAPPPDPKDVEVAEMAPPPAGDEPSESEIGKATDAYWCAVVDAGLEDATRAVQDLCGIRAVLRACRPAPLPPVASVSPMAVDREALGMEVRRVWVDFARSQPNPKPHHLAPWADLDAPSKEVDRIIGETLFSLGAEAAFAAYRATFVRDQGPVVVVDARVARARASLRLPAAPLPMAAPVTEMEIVAARREIHEVCGNTVNPVAIHAALTAFAAGRVASDAGYIEAITQRDLAWHNQRQAELRAEKAEVEVERLRVTNGKGFV